MWLRDWILQSHDDPSKFLFRIYSGNTLRLKDAKALSIVEGEQRNGVELMIPLKRLHEIAGRGRCNE